MTFTYLRYAEVSKETYLYGKRGLLRFADLRHASISRSLLPYHRSLLTHNVTCLRVSCVRVCVCACVYNRSLLSYGRPLFTSLLTLTHTIHLTQTRPCGWRHGRSRWQTRTCSLARTHFCAFYYRRTWATTKSYTGPKPSATT